jgi:hypothetical protein
VRLTITDEHGRALHVVGETPPGGHTVLAREFPSGVLVPVAVLSAAGALQLAAHLITMAGASTRVVPCPKCAHHTHKVKGAAESGACGGPE